MTYTKKTNPQIIIRQNISLKLVVLVPLVLLELVVILDLKTDVTKKIINGHNLSLPVV